MNKAIVVHYMNKYPGGRVDASENSMVVYCSEGQKRVHMVKDGLGAWKDISEEMGCSDKHDLGALPKYARAWKLHKDGKIGKAEEHAARSKHVAGVVKVPGAQGRDPSTLKEGECPIEAGCFNSDEAGKMMEPKKA